MDYSSLINLGTVLTGAFATLAVLRWRVKIIERDIHTMQKIAEKLLHRIEEYERMNGREHRAFDVTLTRLEVTQQAAEVAADAILELLKHQGHNTESYRRRLTHPSVDQPTHREGA